MSVVQPGQPAADPDPRRGGPWRRSRPRARPPGRRRPRPPSSGAGTGSRPRHAARAATSPATTPVTGRRGGARTHRRAEEGLHVGPVRRTGRQHRHPRPAALDPARRNRKPQAVLVPGAEPQHAATPGQDTGRRCHCRRRVGRGCARRRPSAAGTPVPAGGDPDGHPWCKTSDAVSGRFGGVTGQGCQGSGAQPGAGDGEPSSG